PLVTLASHLNSTGKVKTEFLTHLDGSKCKSAFHSL
ncbi:unnamed protein product, partial [marine sediment metagenome]